MLSPANRNVTTDAPPELPDSFSEMNVVTACAGRNNHQRPAGLFAFACRILKDRNLYGSLAFAETAESLRLNLQALHAGEGDRVVGVTSSGDLLLALLASRPDAVRGFDANTVQTVLTHLKAAAVSVLSVDDYLGFMGVTGAEPAARMGTFNRISRSMPPHARRELLKRQKVIEGGILNYGMTHLIIQVMTAVVSRLLHPESMALFLGRCGTDQDRLEKLDQLQQNRSFRYLLQPFLKAAGPGLKWLFFPHRFCRISSRPDEIIADFFTVFRDLLVRGVRSNPVLCRSAVGRLHPEWRQYFYNESTFRCIRKNINRLSLETADIISGLRRVADGWATRVYLSNVPDYLSAAQLSDLVCELQRVAAPGARIVYYSLYDDDQLRALGAPVPKKELRAVRDSDNVCIYPMIMIRRKGMA